MKMIPSKTVAELNGQKQQEHMRVKINLYGKK